MEALIIAWAFLGFLGLLYIGGEIALRHRDERLRVERQAYDENTFAESMSAPGIPRSFSTFFYATLSRYCLNSDQPYYAIFPNDRVNEYLGDGMDWVGFENHLELRDPTEEQRKAMRPIITVSDYVVVAYPLWTHARESSNV